MAKKKSQATRVAQRQASAERAAAVMAEQRKQERRRRNRVIAIAAAVVLVLLLGIGYAVQANRDTTGEAAAVPAGAVDDYALAVGPADAPATVTVYEDFMCPFCGQFEAASRDMLNGHVDAGNARVEYRVISFLDQASNGTEYSTRAMNALGVVLDSSGVEVADRFHDLLFDNQPEEGTDGLSDDELVDLAVRAGADENEVRGPIEDRQFEQWVVNATNDANKAGISSTPTVMVDGEKIEATTIDGLVAEVDKRLQEAAAG